MMFSSTFPQFMFIYQIESETKKHKPRKNFVKNMCKQQQLRRKSFFRFFCGNCFAKCFCWKGKKFVDEYKKLQSKSRKLLHKPFKNVRDD